MSEIFIKILNMSLAASYCIAVVMVLRFFFRKQPKILSYLLWSVVLFRLVCPFSISGSYSLMRLDTDIISQENMMRWSGAETENNWETVDNVEQNAANGADTEKDLHTSEANAGEAFSLQKVVDIAAWIWFGGVILLICYSVGKAISLAYFLKSAVRIERNQYEAEGIDTPFVFGLIKPRIYLPVYLQAEDKKYVLEHENIHIARKDYFVKAAAYAALCIHWFNPLVWLAFALMEKDMEMSCDEAVLKKLGMDVKKDYSMSLLSLSTEKTMFRGNPLAFGEGKVKDRIQNILSYQKRTFWAVLAAAIVLLAVGAGLILNPAKQTNAEQMSEEDREKITALVEDYAEACCARDGAAIVAFYTDEETALASGESRLLEKAGDGYTFGYSSPWPLSYRYEVIWEEGKADIRYYAWTSDPHIFVWREEIEYVKVGEEYRISESSFEILDSISTAEEFERAYLIGGEHHFVDYVENGFVEAINLQREDGTSAADNTVYETPERAAEYILNLTGGESIVEGNYSFQATVRYQFADGSEVMIPVYDANYDWQSGSEQGEPVWIVDTAVWNAKAP